MKTVTNYMPYSNDATDNLYLGYVDVESGLFLRKRTERRLVYKNCEDGVWRDLETWEVMDSKKIESLKAHKKALDHFELISNKGEG